MPEAPATSPRSRHRGALLGLALGDALGTTVEFAPRGRFAPLTDVVGGGPFHLPPGAWTDDTSMALCLARSLLDCGGFDAGDQMRRYVRWWRSGYLSSTGRCFDIGTTVRNALARFETTGDPYAGSTDPQTAGNGALMRLASVALYFAADREALLAHAAASARTTHGATEAVDACRLLASQLQRALEGAPKEEILRAPGRFDPPLAPALDALARGGYREKPASAIRGSGYAVESLEAALWCFARGTSFREAVLLAANLGDDADTTAAICGQLAGAFYGEEGIPAPWRALLLRGLEIARLADALRRAGTKRPAPWARSYWANPGALVAGAYPGDLDRAAAEAKATALLDSGVRLFVNLTERHETDRRGRTFEPYEHVVRRLAAARGIQVACRRFGIVDVSVPSLALMTEIQGCLDAALDADDVAYVHCLGGRGRTGTVVGVHLISHGLAEPEDFVEAIARRRSGDASGGPSPETGAQIEFVRRFVASA